MKWLAVTTFGVILAVSSTGLSDVLAQDNPPPPIPKELPSKNPLEGNAEAVRAGMGLFRVRCADCHGMDARGIRAPDLTQVWARGRTDDGLFRTLRTGVSGTEMPAVIRASDDDVWRILTAIERWPTWNSDVKSVSIDGPPVEGTTFRWKAGPGTISSTVTRVDRPRLIAWTGRTLGISAVHVWHFEQRGGRTHVSTEESYEGLVARVLRRSLQKTLDAALADGVRQLKAEAERVNPTPP